MIKSSIQEFIRRWNAETPKIWKRIRNAAFSVGGSLAAVIAANAELSLDINPQIMTYAKYGLAVCILIYGKAQIQEQK
jgi:hypothetical protein